MKRIMHFMHRPHLRYEPSGWQRCVCGAVQMTGDPWHMWIKGKIGYIVPENRKPEPEYGVVDATK